MMINERIPQRQNFDKGAHISDGDACIGGLAVYQGYRNRKRISTAKAINMSA
jgi:hypothetical protein